MVAREEVELERVADVRIGSGLELVDDAFADQGADQPLP